MIPWMRFSTVFLCLHLHMVAAAAKGCNQEHATDLLDPEVGFIPSRGYMRKGNNSLAGIHKLSASHILKLINEGQFTLVRLL